MSWVKEMKQGMSMNKLKCFSHLALLFPCTPAPLADWLEHLESLSKTEENTSLSYWVMTNDQISMTGFSPMIEPYGSYHGSSWEWMIILMKWCKMKNEKYGKI